MPQKPVRITTINDTTPLADAALPVDPTMLVEVQPSVSGGAAGPPRQKITVADIVGGGGGVAGSGTATHVALWSAGTTIGDSIITDDGTTATTTGNQHVTGTSHTGGASALDGGVTLGSFVTLHGVAFSEVPGSPAVGMVIRINNSSVDTYGGIADGAGALDVIAWYDGTHWSVMGKVGA